MSAKQGIVATLPAPLAGLLDEAAYPHAAASPTLIETHVSWVLLAGEYAYKIKKPVNLGFLDFASRARRDAACREELRLNRRQAASLYLGISSIFPDDQTGVRMVDGEHPGAVEFAVRMRRFPQSAQLDRQLEAGRLMPADMEQIAAGIARFHQQAAVADADRAPVENLLHAACANFEWLPGAGRQGESGELQAWTRREWQRLRPVFAARLEAGFVRECHGDLHLANLVRTDDGIVAFDCIEFDPALRFIDVQDELAFLVMDLMVRDAPALAWRLVNASLARTGDFGGLEVLRFYLVYRSLVRAKVAAIRRQQEQQPRARELSEQRMFAHLGLAARLARQPARAAVLITCGLSGSGKSQLSAALADVLPAIHIRSDVERLRPVMGAPQQQRYTAEARADVYRRLHALAEGIVTAGYAVIVDATFLERQQRDSFRGLADALGVPGLILWCDAPPDTLRERIVRRAAAGKDPSQAGPGVLPGQQVRFEPPGRGERVLRVDPDAARDPQHLARRIARSLHLRPVAA